jgi:hypothetical protein
MPENQPLPRQSYVIEATHKCHDSRDCASSSWRGFAATPLWLLDMTTCFCRTTVTFFLSLLIDRNECALNTAAALRMRQPIKAQEEYPAQGADMGNTTIKISGVHDSRGEPSDLARGLPSSSLTVKGAALVQAARAGRPQVTLDNLEPDDVVEIELEDGVRVWSRVSDLARNLGLRDTRAEDAGTLQLPAQLMTGPSSRSLGGWAIKALKVLGIDIAGEIAEFVSALAACWLPAPREPCGSSHGNAHGMMACPGRRHRQGLRLRSDRLQRFTADRVRFEELG